jgi:hypothetical protein
VTTDTAGAPDPFRSSNGAGANPQELGRRTAELLQRTAKEAERADTKASILLAGVLAVAGGVSALLSGVHWSPSAQPVVVQVIWWGAVGAVVVALVLLAAAVYPRSHRDDGQRTHVGYFGDVLRFPSAEALGQHLQTGPGDAQTIDVDQLWQLSHVVGSKYRYIRLAIDALGVMLALLVVLALASTVG